MNTGDTYFQFPLCALAFCADQKERLDHIISFGFVEAGRVMLRKLPSAVRSEKAEFFAAWPQTPADYRKTKSDHVAAMLGAEAIGIKMGSLTGSLDCHQALTEFRFQFQQTYGCDVEVRVAKSLVVEARDGTGISYRELAILGAVYSCIGAKKYPCRITRATIQCRMLGYKSGKIMRAEIAKRKDAAQPLTLRQINYVLDKLHERLFFARARPNKRQTFYSNRLTQDQLEDKLVEGKSYSEGFHQRRVERNLDLIRRIKERRATIKVSTPIKVDNAKAVGSNGVHSASAGVIAGGSS